MNYVAGFHAVISLLRTQPHTIVEILLLSSRSDARVNEVLLLAQQHHVAVRHASRQEFDQTLANPAIQHQGVIAKHPTFDGFDENILDDIIAHATKPLLLLVLDGVQDPHNLGACLRTANGFGVDAVIVPKDRACGLTPVVHKVACGAASVTPFIRVTNLSRTLKNIQKQGVWVVGLTTGVDIMISEIDLTCSIAMILGNEGQGIRKLTLAQCDYTAHIPLHGSIESFNVATATAISLYEATRQRMCKIT